MAVPAESIDRATFLRRIGAVLVTGFLTRLGRVRAASARPAAFHPDPRPGVTAERVLPANGIDSSDPEVLAAYELARGYPEIFDGVGCGCSCGGKRGTHRSLLVCFETQQPTGCGACRSEGMLVGRLAKSGKSLPEIREAADAEFG